MNRKLQPGEFLGEIVKSVHVADAHLTLVRHDTKRTLDAHTHSAAYFCLLMHGGYNEHYRDRHIEYKPFTIALHPAGYEHWDEIGADGSVFFMIELGQEWNVKLGDVLDLKTVQVELRGHDMVWLAMRIFKEFSEFDRESELQIEALLYELIAAAARLPERHEGGVDWFARAIAFLDDHFTESLSMKQIADVACVHPVTLARAFRVQLGQTASEYINRLRVRLACEIVLAREVPLAAIAADCGFIDQSYFTKVFKSVTGTTPAAFRQTVTGTIPDRTL